MTDVFLEIDEACVIQEVEITEAVIIIDTGGGGGGTIPETTNLLAGDGDGNAADAGFAATAVVQKQPAFPTPTNIFEIIQCLQNAGLCA